MGYIKIKAAGQLPGFPRAIVEAQDPIPLDQCTEAKIEGTDATTTTTPAELTNVGAFVGLTLDGKSCTILESTGGNTGEFPIVSNTDDVLTLTGDPGIGTAVAYQLHDAGELEITRNTAELAALAHAAEKAHTFLNGKLYTDMLEANFEAACSILWDPLT
ncbi:hypothetical protein ES703_109937 [subsurface metagenome]